MSGNPSSKTKQGRVLEWTDLLDDDLDNLKFHIETMIHNNPAILPIVMNIGTDRFAEAFRAELEGIFPNLKTIPFDPENDVRTIQSFYLSSSNTRGQNAANDEGPNMTRQDAPTDYGSTNTDPAGPDNRLFTSIQPREFQAVQQHPTISPVRQGLAAVSVQQAPSPAKAVDQKAGLSDPQFYNPFAHPPVAAFGAKTPKGKKTPKK